MRERIRGSIGYFGLEDWWLTSFSDEERDYIRKTFQPLGSSGGSLTSGHVSWSNETAVGLLQALAGWFTKVADRSIAHRALAKAAEIAGRGGNLLDIHFMYQQMITMYYKDRDQPEFMEKTIEACQRQIELSPEAKKAFLRDYQDSPLPGHKGFEQLSIILDKQGAFAESIQLCQRAYAEGWAGDWGKRIERSKKKCQRDSTGSESHGRVESPFERT